MAVKRDSIQVSIDIETQQGVRAYQNLLDETKKVNAEMRRLKRSGQENSDEFKKLEKRSGELNRELAKLGGAGANMGQLIARSRELNRELRSLVPGTERFIRATEELKAVNTRLADIRKQTKGVSQGMDEMKGAGMGLPPVFGKIAGAMKAFLALQVIQFFVDLFRVVDETTIAFRKFRGEIEQATGATGDTLDQYTAKVSAIGQTFGAETQEILTAANALTKQLTGDFAESLDLIEKGFLAGANRGGDFLDQVKEYPAFFREAGLSGQQMISVLSQSIQEGVFSDKGADLIKEFNLRIRELTPPTVAALNRIGITSEEIGKQIREKGIGGAFLLVQDRLKDIQDTAPETGAVLADVFGGPGEDAGIQFVKNLQLTDDSLNNLIDTGNDYTAALIDQLQANEDLAGAQNRVSKQFGDTSNALNIYITRIKTFLFNTAADLLEFFEGLPIAVAGIKAAFKTVLDNIEGFFDRTYINVQITLKKIEKLNPFGKTSEQLDEEINNLRNKRQELNDSAVGVMQAFYGAVIEEGKKAENRKAVSEALLPPPDEETIRKNARANAETVQKIQEEETAKVQQERKGIAPLAAIGGAAGGQVSSTGQGGGDTDAQINLVDNALLKGILSVQEAEDRKFQIEQEAYERRLEWLREKQGEESAAFIALENEKLRAQQDYEAQRLDLTQRTEEARQILLGQGIDALGGFLDQTISFLSDEEKARKKHSGVLKAFEAAKVTIAGVTEIQKIWEASAGFGPLQAVIAGIQTAFAVARTTNAISKINSTGFYSGGYTGATPLFKDSQGRNVVGGVHENEWVAPEWQTRHPVYGPVIGWLENMRRNGYQEGGFAGVNAIPSSGAVGSAPPAAPQISGQLEEMFREIRDSNMEMARVIRDKQFSVVSGQIVDALDEETRLNKKSAF